MTSALANTQVICLSANAWRSGDAMEGCVKAMGSCFGQSYLVRFLRVL